MEYHELTERTYINAAKDRVVAENDPEAAFLLGAPGELIPKTQADSLGLTGAAPPEEDDVDEGVEDKMVRGPRSTRRPPRPEPKAADVTVSEPLIEPPAEATAAPQPAAAEPQPAPPEGGA